MEAKEKVNFLEYFTDYYIKNYSEKISDICFVFPGRRAGVYFKKILKEKVNHPIWQPTILTISDFFYTLSGMTPSDDITLLFRLHNCYREKMGIDISIDEFIPFGETIISDFNDIDNFMVDAEKLFANLLAYKALEDDFSHLSEFQIEAIKTFWRSFDPQKLSIHQQEFLSIWNKMYDLYVNFKQLLTENNEAYKGMIYRTVSEKIKNERYIDIPYKHVVFAGFNSLNNCEKILFNILYLQGKASFFWDYPQWLIDLDKKKPPNFPDHEAIIFIKQNLLNFPSPKDWKMPEWRSLPDITITSTPNDVVMAQVAASKINGDKISENRKNTEKTAIVLADETLVFTVLDSIPAEIESINITLGYPIKNTPAFTLVESVLNFQKTVRTTKEGNTWYYHRPLLALLRHQYISKILGAKSNELIKKIINSKQIYVEKESLQLDNQTAKLLSKVDTIDELMTYLDAILSQSLEILSENKNFILDHEFVFYIQLIIRRLSDVLNEHNQTPTIDSWFVLFKKLTESSFVSFRGEPVKGLQIMGIQETRLLDFDKIIIPGMNEGIFPKTSSINSLIPYNLRKGNGLPTDENRIAIFAYYFYRMLNRTREINLLYSTTKRAISDGEMSRFLQQLYYEYPGKVKIENVSQSLKIKKKLKIIAEKNDKVLKIMQKFVNQDSILSPSALSVYISCPLQFYFKNIAGIKEPDEISEDLDKKTFGNLFHQVCEEIYKPFIGKNVTANDINSILADENAIKKHLNFVFEKNIPLVKQVSAIFIDLQGKNSLVYEVLLKYIKKFLMLEIENTPFQLISLEKRVFLPYKITSEITVNIGGIIDRIDIKDNCMKIIDYKTGKTVQLIKSIDDLFDTKKHTDYKAIFQILVYAYIESQNTKNEIIPAVISTLKLFSEKFSDNLILKPDKSTEEIITYNLVKEPFTQRLDKLLKEIFSKDIPFFQTEHKKTCEYCSFIQHCGII